MDSKEILLQYLVGAMSGVSALEELDQKGKITVTLSEQTEAGIARYAIGFIKRIQQYKTGIASPKDLCLSIRDMVLVFGRTSLPGKLYNLAKEYGSEFGLVCEGNRQVSCQMNIPVWLSPKQYVKDVYALKQDSLTESEKISSGDALLHKNTIFSNYKSYEQKLAIYTAINLPVNHCLLISQPTGGGKSLITQILSSVTNGLTVVIVPTVALALDQLSAAKHNLRDNDSIFCYRGEQTAAERSSIINAISQQTAKILFISPEAIIKNNELYQLLDEAAANKYLKNIVIDEAHIVPDWGIFFRPDFQLLSIAIAKWRRLSEKTLRTYLLSATLSDDVVDTLFTLFGIEGCNVQLRCDALRQEPRFYFYSTKTRAEQYDKLYESICKLPKPMIVYVLEPKEAQDIKRKLSEKGFLNIPVFTGLTKDADRKRILAGWKDNEYDIVIATSAFGIGVDKPNVRTIIHACCPENLSRFYQEVGRGGRDHLPSLSVLLPYQNPHDGQGDVRRALGLVQKRVLKVETSLIRWNSMLSSNSAIVYPDYCILDTSTPPITMTDEEAEFAGNQNAAWNINLLLFLKRTGFIDLEDVKFLPEKNTYTITARYLKPDILNSPEQMRLALQEPRQREYDRQMAGYYAMRDLISAPQRICWGHAFKQLFPLSAEICNGCPSDLYGKITIDSDIKVRNTPRLQLKPHAYSARLARNIGSYNELVIERTVTGNYTSEEIELICNKAASCAVRVFVLPNDCHLYVKSDGLILNYDEFLFSVKQTPYLFAGGVLCLMDVDKFNNILLYKNLCKLEDYSYIRVIYAHPNTVILPNGRTIREAIEGYTISINKF